MVTLAEVDEKLTELRRLMRAVLAGEVEQCAVTRAPAQPAADASPPLPAADPQLHQATPPGGRPSGVAAAPGGADAPDTGSERGPDDSSAWSTELTGSRERLRFGLAELTATADEIEAVIARLATVRAQTGRVAAPAAPEPAIVAPGVAAPHERVFEGRVMVDGGPFQDVAAVTTFHRALERLPGSRGACLTGFGLHRARVELELEHPVALGREIRSVMPFDFAISAAGHNRLVIHVGAAATIGPA